MANTLRFKRGLVAGIPTALAGEPLFTTDTFDLYIGNGTTNTRFQKYIASGTTAQYLRGDGSLATFPTDVITGTGVSGQVAYWSGANTQVGSNNLFWDNTNGRLGIGTITPSTTLDIRGKTKIETSSNCELDFVNSANSMRVSMGSTIGFIGTLSNNSFAFFTAATERARFHTGGNFHLGGTADSGQRLQVTGDTLLKGSGATSATTALSVQNSAGTSIFNVRNDGSVGIGGTAGAASLLLQKTIIGTGSVFGYGVLQEGAVQSNVTSFVMGFYNLLQTQVASFTLNSYHHYFAQQATLGAGSAINNQYGYFVDATLTGATNNFGFYGNIAAATNRWNLYMNGTAANYFAGNVGIGNATPSRPLVVNGDTTLGGNNYIGLTKIIQWEGAAYWALRTTSSGNQFEIFRGDTITTPFGISSSNNILVGSVATDSGEKLQVNGTMKVTGASTFGGETSIVTGSNAILNIDGLSTSTTGLIIKGSGVERGRISFSNSTTMRFFIGSGVNQYLEIDATTRAATFSSSVQAGGNLLLTNGGASSIGAINLIRTGTSPVASRLTFGTDGTGYSFAIGKNQAGSVTDLVSILDSGAANFTTSIQAGTAIAIGTTPDTNKPFKILKNINATVGINFENTSTSSLAFSAIQMGTDVTGGTKFTNLVYASSGVTANGVYNPDGTSLINNGGGGLNFLGTPTRFYTGGSNGVLRFMLDNEGATQYTATTPTTNATDGYKQYSADVVAGNAAPHFRTENGAVIKLYQETTAVGNSTISVGGGSAVLDDTQFGGYTLRQVVQALRNQGILA